MVQQPLHVRRHGRGLRDVGASGVEASLVRVVLDTDLLPLRSHEAVAASDGVWGSDLLSGGSVIIGKTGNDRIEINLTSYSVPYLKL